ncbi:polyphosphate kinase 1 [Spirosoma soli]|uniref:Polyphosphate kinase n=1 Tax=Spirosoma soli TaxID=1770529 RepID=A0ABW5M6P0_9BACT
MLSHRPSVYFNRDLSWLSFNHRVLQEAGNPAVPLYERIRFLSIFSSNLDEFFRVRMSALLTLGELGTAENDGADPSLLPEVQATVQRCQEEFGALFRKQILPELAKQGIHLYYGEPLLPEHKPAVANYFFSRVLAFLQPLWLDRVYKEPLHLPDNALYLAVVLAPSATPNQPQYVLVPIPRQNMPRFFELPSTDSQQHILFLDDVVRQHLSTIFPDYTVEGCYSIKINRNADVSIADEFSGEMDTNVAQMLEQRNAGQPTRFLYDASMPPNLLNFLADYLAMTKPELIPGGRYHTLSDLASLPNPVGAALTYPPQPPLSYQALQQEVSLFAQIEQRDRLVHLPYQSYDPILRFFNEAAIDPYVREIYVTLYRVASESYIVNALISAAKNGKQVTVFVELKARFDEANNLKWGKKLKAAGVRLVYSIPSLKVHAKTALVKRQRNGQTRQYGLLATGNFNESTARFYTDHVLMTCHAGITQELDQLFSYLQSRKQPAGYPALIFNHLLVAPFNLTNRFLALIDREIAHRRAGRDARITIKLNNLQEKTMIDKLYEASQAGVRVELIVRAISTLVPGVPALSEHITVRRIVDRYLEHGRVFIFQNNGQPETYLGSADWMNRNLHRRIEVCFPIYDASLQEQLGQLMAIQLADNTQARYIDSQLNMEPIGNHEPPLRSQDAIYTHLRSAQLPTIS